MSEPRAKIIAVSGPGKGKQVELAAGKTVRIGRATGMEMKLDDPSVSRCHAEVLFDGKVVRLKDAGSSHGVFIDGKRVTDSMIGAGTRFFLGDTEIEVRIELPEPLPSIDGYRVTGKVGQGGMG